MGLNALQLYCQCFVLFLCASRLFPRRCLVLSSLSAVSPSWCRIRTCVCNPPLRARAQNPLLKPDFSNEGACRLFVPPLPPHSPAPARKASKRHSMGCTLDPRTCTDVHNGRPSPGDRAREKIIATALLRLFSLLSRGKPSLLELRCFSRGLMEDL